ncbi:retrovirus-related pol polyprotein from transposon TNT 1-94 [Tanacetum coccineum]
MRPFGCSITILNTRDHLGKFDGKADEGFFVGYSTNSNAFRVLNSRTRIVEENLHVKFSKATPNITGSGPNWLFDIDALTKSMNYEPIVAGNQSNGSACTKACYDAGKARMETVPCKYYILLPFLTQDRSISFSSKDSPDVGFKPSEDEEKKDAKDPDNKDKNNVTDENIVYGCDDDPNMPNLEEIVYSDDDEGVDAKADMTNLDTNIFVSPTLTTRIHKDHPLEQIIGDIHSAPQTRRMTKNVTKHVEPKKGYTQEERIDYDEVFAPVARIEVIRLFFAYASFKDFVVYQMDVKSAFLYGKIEEEVYVCQPLGFEDPEFPNRVYKVEKALYGLHQAHSAWYETLSTYLLDNRFQRGQIDKSLFIKRVKGLQVTQKDDGIFISQDNYVDEILKKFGFSTVKTASTPMETLNPLLKDAEAEDVVVYLYRSMIRSLMYLTASRPDIMFDVCACTRFQVTPKVSHLHTVKRIFRYLKDETVINKWEDRMQRDATTASSLEAEQDSGNINRTQSMATLNESFSQGTDFGSSTRCQDTILGGAKAQIRFEAAFKQFNDPHLSRVNTLRSGEDSMKLKELMEFYAKLSDREDASKQGRKIVDLDVDIEVTLIDETQGRNDEDLMFDAGVLNSDEVFQEPIVNTDSTTKSSIPVSAADPVTTTGEVVTTASVEIPEELTLAQTLIEIKRAKPKAVTTTTVKLARSRPKAKGIVFHDQEEQASASTPIVSPLQLPQAKDKGKAKMVKPKKPLKKKDQIAIDEEVARNLEAQLQAELKEEERLSRQKEEEANIALMESWDNTQAMMDADFQLAQQMQTEEQEQLSIEEKSKLFVELLEKRNKNFAALRAQEKRNKPPTKAQKRNTMSTYLKNIAGYKHNPLKSKSYDEIQEMFDKEMKRVNTFIDMDTELVKGSKTKAEGSFKRAREELESDNSKKQRIDEHVEAKGDDDQEEAEMNKHMEIVQDDEVEIDAIPLATKPPVIVEWKTIKEGKMGYFQLIRVDGSSKRYSSMIQMLQNIDREDLETLWKLVKAKHGNTRPEEAYERVLWGDLKVMFELDIESEVWRSLEGHNVTVWKLFSSSGVHFVRFKNLHIFMLVEKKYPLTPATITGMLNKKLQVDQWNEIISAAYTKVNAADMKVTTAERLQLLEEFLLLEG